MAQTGQQPQALEEEGGTEPTTYHNAFTAVPGDTPWRPTPPHRPIMDGPQMAIVTGPAGEEIHCDEHGRVKVRFPWDRYSQNDEHSSAWLRVSQGWAGGQYGFFTLPRIGNEVIVSFLNGDPDQPIITGRTHHATNTPPETLPKHKTRTTLKTQTHKGEGHNELRFEDEADQQQIYVHAQKDLDLLTENDRTEVVKNNQHLTVHTDRVQQVKGNDHRTVDGETREKIGGDHSLTVGGSHHSHQGKGQLIEAGQEIHHKAGMKVVIEAGAEVTLAAGGSFVKVDPSGVSVSGPMVKMNSGGAPGSGSGVSAQSPGSPQGVTAKGGKVEPEALATTDQRPEGDPSATIDRLKAAAATGAVSASACNQDGQGKCTVHDHGSEPNTALQSAPDSHGRTASNDSDSEDATEAEIEPGFHVVRQPMTKTELIKILYGDVSAKPDHFDRLNPDLSNRVLPGEMIVLGDPEAKACTQKESDLMAVAKEVNQQVRSLDEKEAQFITDHYDLLETLTSTTQTGLGAGAVMISKQVQGIEANLRELEALHQESYRKHGHLNSQEFFDKRKAIFRKLDFSLGKVARKGLALDDNPKLKKSLGLSTKSIVHHWKHSGVGGIPGYATHYDRLTAGAKYAKAGGYVAIALDVALAEMRIKEVCTSGSARECSKIKYTERGRVAGSTAGGALGAAVGGATCFAVGITTAGVGGVACAIILGGTGSAVGGTAGGAVGEFSGEAIYEKTYTE